MDVSFLFTVASTFLCTVVSTDNTLHSPMYCNLFMQPSNYSIRPTNGVHVIFRRLKFRLSPLYRRTPNNRAVHSVHNNHTTSSSQMDSKKCAMTTTTNTVAAFNHEEKLDRAARSKWLKTTQPTTKPATTELMSQQEVGQQNDKVSLQMSSQVNGFFSKRLRIVSELNPQYLVGGKNQLNCKI